MAQWDVYPNPSARSRDEIPYLVDLQSDLLSNLETRFVAPLAHTRLGKAGLPRALCPSFRIEGQTLLLLPQEAASIAARLLAKRRVLSLRDHAHDIVAAFDALISGV